MQQLPGRGPQWQCTKLKLKGYESEQPIHLIWRDGLEVTKQLFANPVYANHMCYDPHYIYQGQERQFGEFWTSDDAWEIQVSSRTLVRGYSSDARQYRINCLKGRLLFQSSPPLTKPR